MLLMEADRETEVIISLEEWNLLTGYVGDKRKKTISNSLDTNHTNSSDKEEN